MFITKSNIVFFLLTFLFSCSPNQEQQPINRQALVERNTVVILSPDSLSSLSAGNGNFAFTVDFTGLQTFPSEYEHGIPLGTFSNWAWHSFPNTEGYKFGECLRDYEFHGRKVSYGVEWNNLLRKEEAADYLRSNPHRLHLGIVGLDLLHENGSPVTRGEVKFISQSLNPWTGRILSSFEVDDYPVEVTTYVHQELDVVSTRIVSPLLEKGLIRIRVRFPYPSGQHTDGGCDWTKPDQHASVIRFQTENTATINRRLDSTTYSVNMLWSDPAGITETGSNDFLITPAGGSEEFSMNVYFSPENLEPRVPDFRTTEMNNRVLWETFWNNGGAVDFSGSTDPRAKELERRVILSQYLTKIQCTGLLPPQETGLTYNSWFGKFHLEMHWWHAAHFALWNREALFEESLSYYGHISENAWTTAKRQGFKGYRWPKMTDPSGNDSPSGIGPFLIWQQPHIIYLAELCYRNDQDISTIRKYAGLVFATADFMASYAWYDVKNNRYLLGPDLIPAQEKFPPETTINPPFELSYWYFGLSTAQKWRERLGLKRNVLWDSVLMKLSSLAKNDSLYLAAESARDSYTNTRFLTDHPVVLGAYGMLPLSRLIDTLTMKSTFDYIWDHWNWSETWGWDFPLVAMAATRLGMPEKAVDALFIDAPSNTWLPNGHNYQND